MAMKFYGSLSTLAEFLRRHCNDGSWHEQPHFVHMLRTDYRVNVLWASTTKTIWCTGPQPHNGRITRKLLNALATHQAEIEDPNGDELDEDFELDWDDEVDI